MADTDMPSFFYSLPDNKKLSADEWLMGLREQLSRQLEATHQARQAEREKTAEAEKLTQRNRELVASIGETSSQLHHLNQQNLTLEATVKRQQHELAKMTMEQVTLLDEVKPKAEMAEQLQCTVARQTEELAELTQLLLSTESRLKLYEQVLWDFSVARMAHLQETEAEDGLLSNLTTRLRRPSQPQAIDADVALLQAVPFFDASWYLENNPDVAAADANPYKHYLESGAAEGRQPSRLFDGQWYLKAYEDVKETGMNPLLHFLRFGMHEGRSPLPPVGQE